MEDQHVPEGKGFAEEVDGHEGGEEAQDRPGVGKGNESEKEHEVPEDEVLPMVVEGSIKDPADEGRFFAPVRL